MTNFKDLMRNTDITLNKLSEIQNNLLKNQKNPVFSEKDKNKILKFYDVIENIGKSVYRYDNFKQNNMLSEAEDENQKINDTVLKCGISNVKYVWRSENGENTCDKCKALDGKEFDFEDEVPERPHPNCKCYVEIVEDNKDKPKPKDENEEPCDCWKFIEQINVLLNQLETLKEEIAIRSSYVFEILSYDMTLWLEEEGQELLKLYSSLGWIVNDLSSTFYESRQNIFENSDKFYHMKAFCKVAQRESEINNQIALGMGWCREIYQKYESYLTREKSWEEAVKDYQEDMAANRKGIELGTENPNDDCEIIIKRIWPHDLKTNY